MKKLKLVSKSGLFLAFALILFVAVVDASFPNGKIFYKGSKAIDFSAVSDFLFVVSIIMFIISMFLRTLTKEGAWNGLVKFSKYFVPVGVVFYFVSAFLSEGKIELFGVPSFESPQYWVGIVLVFIYGLGMFYFSLKTFYQKW